MAKGYMYILHCADGSYYTGSTKDLGLRLEQHQNGSGANFTRKHLPVKLVYYEEFDRIDEAFYREKQVQGWSRKKKEALIARDINQLHELAKCRASAPLSPLRSSFLSEAEGSEAEGNLASTALSQQQDSPLSEAEGEINNHQKIK